MDEEGADVAEDEYECDALCLEAEDLVVREEEVDHAAEDHVDEGVDPERGKEDEKLLRGGVGGVELVLDAEGAEDVASRLPGAAHDEDPGEGFLMQDGLEDVREGCEAEEADEEDCGAVGGAVVPLGVGVSDGVAFEVWHCWGWLMAGGRSQILI